MVLPGSVQFIFTIDFTSVTLYNISSVSSGRSAAKPYRQCLGSPMIIPEEHLAADAVFYQSRKRSRNGINICSLWYDGSVFERMVARLLMSLALIQDGYPPAIVPPILRVDYVSLLERAHRDDRDFMEFIAEREFESQKEMLRLFQIPFPREGQE